MTVPEAPNRHENDKAADVVVRSSRDEDVTAMVAIYLHHIRVGVDATGSYGFDAPELTDLKRRRKNMQKHRLPHLVAELDGRVIGYARCFQSSLDSIARNLRVLAGGLSAVDRIQIRPLDGFGDHAAFARAGGHKPT
jgi:hypothetical protein